MPFFDVLRANENRFSILRGIFAVPNAGKRNGLTGYEMQREGLKKGCWDVVVPFARHGFNLFFIEFKYGKNQLTDSQIEWRKIFADERVFWETHWLPETALGSLEWYLSIKLNR